MVIRYGFVLALVVIVVGSVHKYRELSEEEQKAAVKLLAQEISGNIAVVGELQKNIENILRNTKVVRDSLRDPGIRLLSTLFPDENTNPAVQVPASLGYAREQMEFAQAEGLFEDELELNKFTQAANAISGTIGRTMQTIENLADIEGTRYRISDEAWKANLPILRKIHVVDIPAFQAIYRDMERLRANYTVSVNYAVQYLKVLQRFFSNGDIPYTPERLASVLAAERIFMTTMTEYAKIVVEKLEAIERARRRLAVS